MGEGKKIVLGHIKLPPKWLQGYSDKYGELSWVDNKVGSIARWFYRYRLLAQGVRGKIEVNNKVVQRYVGINKGLVAEVAQLKETNWQLRAQLYNTEPKEEHN